MSAALQTQALLAAGVPPDDIGRDLGLDPLAVKVAATNQYDFTEDERLVAKHAIIGIAKGGIDIPPAVQLKAAIHVHTNGKVENGGGLSIQNLSIAILQARAAYEEKRRALYADEAGNGGASAGAISV